ncbi:MAG: UDP-N-acetylglucosamine pyrophosphorylase [Clostridia bacterium]|nr:UDP-N-acetylglucosamine pyrophosphorylase [Clostridia bacterium]
MSVRCKDLFDKIPVELAELFEGAEFPWEIIGKIKAYLSEIKLCDEFTEIKEGVYVGRDVKISPTAEIIPPAIICEGAEIRQGAYLRGAVYVGRGCVVGNSTEIKNSLLFDGANVPHYNYVGDSILGAKSHMGAGAIASNLKADKSNVTVHADKDYPTGLRKLGAILGDGADIGCGCVLNPGTVVGKNTNIYPMTPVRGVVPECAIMKSADTVVKKEKR